MELSDPNGPPLFCHQIHLHGYFLPPTPVTGSAFFYEVPLLVRITRKPEPSRYPSLHVTGNHLVLLFRNKMNL